jgi:Ca2+-binding RTX toxin-like protein
LATYAFETITAQQALAIGPLDVVTFAGSARGVTVAYNIPAVGPASVTISFGGRSVEFGPGVLEISERGGLDFDGDSRLLIGGAENDALMGFGEADALFGGQGDDTLVGQGGGDVMQGNAGNDRLLGDRGADTLHGGQGNDVIRTAKSLPGDEGDFAHGNMGNDTIYGGSGGDTLLGGQGDDDLQGGEGGDYLSGDLGNDIIRAGAGADTAYGGAGNDTLFSGGGGDRLEGGAGDDLIVTTAGWADGGDGADTLVSSGGGKDVLTGGLGVDRFEFLSPASARFEDADEICDFEDGETLHFDRAIVQPAAPEAYREILAADYASALDQANALIAGGKVAYVAAQVAGGSVVVFAETNGVAADGADAAVILVGRTLADIDWSHIG